MASTSEWTDSENSRIIASYFRMLISELKGDNYSKADERRQVMEKTGRSKGSVEFKHQNISAAMSELGLPHIGGYKPARNFQRQLMELIDEYLRQQVSTEDRLLITQGKPKENPQGANERFAKLMWSHAFGGSEVAARASHADGPHVQAEPAAGVEAASEWFRNGFEGDNSCRYFLFLVGGPGGGKSAAAARIVEQYDLCSGETPLAERSYRYAYNDRSLRVINDATIPQESGRTSIVDDIQEAVDGGDNLVVCANRGVIVDDLGTTTADSRSVGHAIVEWLNGETLNSGEVDLSDGSMLKAEKDHAWAYVRQATVTGSVDNEIRLTVVFLDECSLLEEAPRVTIDNETLCCAPYSVQEFKRTNMRSGSSAATLFKAVADESDGVTFDRQDPRTANLIALSDPGVRDRILSILRASEIASNRSYTYRDLWALLVRANVGMLAERQGIDKADFWVSRRLNSMNKQSGSGLSAAKRRWKAATELGELRFFMTFFLPQNGSGSKATYDLLGQMMRTADPATDAPPGDIRNESDAAQGWATPVQESFAVLGETSSPLYWIQQCGDSELTPVIADFDLLLDKVFVDVMSVFEDKERRAAVQWYGRYLLRMYGMAHGIPATYGDIRLWTQAWNSASRGQMLHDEIARGLNILLLPSRKQQRRGSLEKSIVPTYASRTQALRGPIERPLLVTELDTVDFRASIEGDRIWVDVLRDHERVGKVRLDLALVRLVRTVSDGAAGLTEQAANISPRLERVLSSLLRAAAADQPERTTLRVVSGQTSNRVLLGEMSE